MDVCIKVSFPAFWEKHVAFGRVLPMVAPTSSYTCLKVFSSPPTVLPFNLLCPFVKKVFVSPK